MLYDNFKVVCARYGTNITTLLKNINRSTSLTGKWRSGSSPSIEIVQEMAAYLGITIDEMVTTNPPAQQGISEGDLEWLHIISHIPKDKHPMCKDFLRTHMVEPIKTPAKKRA